MYIKQTRRTDLNESNYENKFNQLEEKNKQLNQPKNKLIEEYSEDVFLHWQAPEFETFPRDKKWYIYLAFLLIAIIAYAIYTNGIIMAITFILIGVVGYIYINKEPRTLDFRITYNGIIVGREIYLFDNIKSFWIFYEPNKIRVISLHLESYLTPYIHIPIDDQDPVKIREILLNYVSEEKHEPGLVETLERLLKL